MGCRVRPLDHRGRGQAVGPRRARERFEASVTAKIEGLGSKIASIRYVEDDPDLVERALHPYVAGRELVDLVLTAGAASTDPADAFFVAIERLGGRLVRRGVPAHPGSMLWLARVGTVPILGLPTCGAYSKATAADLLLPRLLSGEPLGEDRRPARPRRPPHPRPALPVPVLCTGAGRPATDSTALRSASASGSRDMHAAHPPRAV